MIFLDTDHLSVLVDRNCSEHAQLARRLEVAIEALAIPVICLQEQCEGWLVKVRKTQDVHQQISAYDRFVKLFHFVADWDIAPFERDAADTFKALRRQRIRNGTHKSLKSLQWRSPAKRCFYRPTFVIFDRFPVCAWRTG